MWCQAVYGIGFFAIVLAEFTAPGIDRSVGDGVKSMGYNMVYGDENMAVINEVVSDFEKGSMKARIIDGEMAPLPAEDVKCLMSVDRYCSKEMGQMKSVIIKSLKEDCISCSDDEKQKAGRIVASMMAHDPVAWKQFLTRSALQTRPRKEDPIKKQKPTKAPMQFESIGEPEEVPISRSRHTEPGFTVKVKRSVSEVKLKPVSGIIVKRSADQVNFKPSASDFTIKRSTDKPKSSNKVKRSAKQSKEKPSIRLPKL